MNGIVRQKASIDKLWHFSSPVNLFCPREDHMNKVHIASHTGELYSLNEDGTYDIFLMTDGQPNSIAFDHKNNLYVADLANASVRIKKIPTEEEKTNYENEMKRKLEDNDKSQIDKLNHEEEQNKTELSHFSTYDLKMKINRYESESFIGPCALAIDRDRGYLYICDSGYFGTTSLNHKFGSLYMMEIDSESGQIKSLLHNCLAYASDVAIDIERNHVYVAETFENRILKLTENSQEHYNCSHFVQFSGRVGPTAISIDDSGYLFVARFEFQNKDQEIDGVITVINSDGIIVGEIVLPKMPEITGLLIPEKREFLYLTEKTSNSVIRIKILQFMQEVLNYEDNVRNLNSG